MAKTTLGAGRVIDTLTQDELQEIIDRQTRDWFQEQARGMSTARFGTVDSVSSGAVSLPQDDHEWLGPDNGFCWAVQRVSAQGLATNDTLKVFRNSATDGNFLGIITPSTNFSPGSKGCILRGGERLVITGSSLGATGDIVINGEAIQAAELDIYKIL